MGRSAASRNNLGNFILNFSTPGPLKDTEAGSKRAPDGRFRDSCAASKVNALCHELVIGTHLVLFRKRAKKLQKPPARALIALSIPIVPQKNQRDEFRLSSDWSFQPLCPRSRSRAVWASAVRCWHFRTRKM